MNNQPIGFLDSGVGGLTVVKEALRQLPHEDIVFIGDQARLPYGPRPVDQVQAFTWQLTRFLLKQNIKMLVFACNTATADALEVIKPQLQIPVVGVILPGTRAAIKATKNRRIGVIATEGTINSGAYQQAINARDPQLEVISLAVPKFVTLVESGQYATPIARKIVAEMLQPLVGSGIDTLIMGCTHYPLLRPLIQEFMGPEVQLIDSGAEAVSEVSVLLDYFEIAAGNTEHRGKARFYTTASPKMFDQIAADWLDLTDLKAQQVNVTEEGPTCSMN
ncbi:glutamate racemase [Lapidilactobacillus luobeiensis]|uniref:glutamate racemase n=1 Tax=Lapidilactobacillus luobeiensis TaxID=2950371 RepID=UPI0021C4890A|nr:glutamate racemase [Lapidilactobacillus luobeiensis]